MKPSFKTLLMMIVMTLPAQAQATPHYVLTAGLVAQALSNDGTPTADDQVFLPATVVATEPNPALAIVAVEPLPHAGSTEPRSRVRLTCRLPGACLPFYALVTAPQATRGATLKPKPEILMRAGTLATLMLDDRRSHIKVAVISLENGGAGKWIRVASPDHKQIYRGEIVSASLLRGTF